MHASVSPKYPVSRARSGHTHTHIPAHTHPLGRDGHGCRFLEKTLTRIDSVLLIGLIVEILLP